MHGDYVFHGRVRRGDGHIALVRKPVRTNTRENRQLQDTDSLSYRAITCIGDLHLEWIWDMGIPRPDLRQTRLCWGLEDHFECS